MAWKITQLPNGIEYRQTGRFQAYYVEDSTWDPGGIMIVLIIFPLAIIYFISLVFPSPLLLILIPIGPLYGYFKYYRRRKEAYYLLNPKERTIYRSIDNQIFKVAENSKLIYSRKSINRQRRGSSSRKNRSYRVGWSFYLENDGKREEIKQVSSVLNIIAHFF